MWIIIKPIVISMHRQGILLVCIITLSCIVEGSTVSYRQSLTKYTKANPQMGQQTIYQSHTKISPNCIVKCKSSQNYQKLAITIKKQSNSNQQLQKQFLFQNQIPIEFSEITFDSQLCKNPLTFQYMHQIVIKAAKVGNILQVQIDYKDTDEQNYEKGLSKYFAFALFVSSCVFLLLEIFAIVRFIKRKKSTHTDSNLLGKSSRIEQNSVS